MHLRLHSRQAPLALVVLALLAVATESPAQSARDLRRTAPRRSTTVSDTQATELTLTVSTVELRPIQIWVRTAAVVQGDGRSLRSFVSAAEGADIAAGQRVRAFTPDSRSSMYQARITGVRSEGALVRIDSELAGPGREGARHYILEIVTETSDRLSIPNEAIIESGGAQLVYVQEAEGQYAPREIQTGIQGELYTEVLDGLASDEQVVTFGSFFVDAEHKLKGP